MKQARLSRRGKGRYLYDRSRPLAYEPSGQDLLLPCIAKADLMRRARMLEGMISGRPGHDLRIAPLLLATKSHKIAGLNTAVGEHRLGSFATYVQTQRGLQ